MKSIRVVAKAFLRNAEGKYLLLQRSDTDERRPLEWDIPGGAVDAGEDYLAAAVRETVEEAGITLNPAELELGYAMADVTEKGPVCWLIFVGEVDSPEVTLSHEHCDYYWATEQEAREMVTYDRQNSAIVYILDNNLFD